MKPISVWHVVLTWALLLVAAVIVGGCAPAMAADPPKDQHVAAGSLTITFGENGVRHVIEFKPDGDVLVDGVVLGHDARILPAMMKSFRGENSCEDVEKFLNPPAAVEK